jgi:hypothetical protein
MKLNKLLFISMFTLVFGSLNAQNYNVVKTRAFTGIKASSGVNICLVQSDSTFGYSVEGLDILAVKLSVKNKVAHISVSGGMKNHQKVVIFSPEYTFINVSGATDVKSKGKLSGDEIAIYNSGASDVNLILEYKKIRIKASGASDVYLTGYADSLYADMSGASDLSAFDLVTVYSKVKAGGASDVAVNTDSTLVADISGASSIKYKKEPAHKEIHASGAVSSGEPETTWVEVNGNEFSVEEGEDTVRIKFNNNELIVIEDGDNTRVLKRRIEPVHNKKKRRFRGNWAGLEFGVNGYLSPGFSLDVPKEYNFLELNYAKSINFSLNFFQQSINLINNRFGLVTGMGVQWFNYKFYNKNTVLVPDSGKIAGYFDKTPGRSYVKSKLTSSYLVVPLIFEYQTNREHGKSSFHISAGVVGGVRLASHTKQVFNFNGDGKNKPKVHDEFYLQPFKADLTARIGWGPINLFANYALTEMFRKDRGPELYPFTVGFVLPFG